MLKDNKKLILVIILIIIIIGVGITLTKGLKYDLAYSKNQKLSIYIENGFEINDIQEISREVFGNEKTYIQESDTNENFVAITAKTISEEQRGEIISKINEKYTIELNEDTDTQIIKNAKIRGRDIVEPYIYSVTIAIVIFLIYALIKYRNIGVIKVTGTILGMLVLTQGLYLSILAITRMPINRLTMPISLSIVVITAVACTIKLEEMGNIIKKSQKEE